MKKRLFSGLTLLLVLSLALVGCGGATEDGNGGDTEEGTEAADPVNLQLGTGGSAGTYYPLGGAIGQVWKNEVEGVSNVQVNETNASVENIRLLDGGSIDLGMSINFIADYAHQGIEEFEEDGEVTSFGVMGVVYPEVVYAFANPSAGIETVADLEGKVVEVGPPGSGTAVATRQVLEAYGLTFDDIDVRNSNFGDAVSAYKDGGVDAVFAVVSSPSGLVHDVTSTHDVQFLDIVGEELDTLREAHPFYSPFVVEQDEYEGMEADYETVTMQALMLASNDLSEDLVYELTQAMYENTETIAETHNVGNQISLENALNGVTTPLHPGAERYFEEQGIELE
ncbi:TAXI family TRAP transporter solute-binding subunit [Caldalkalibacillus salinus]|uniref:TAXI family TRAP transporter solute-binding subunit n=1 Tax=Caldalkalibacillus salinus TaxID=2803787 RepID=UPI00192185FB|nr:TAXI family TRAP transporter solute-binding subunit [Caldalkalibacillus salinus]